MNLPPLKCTKCHMHTVPGFAPSPHCGGRIGSKHTFVLANEPCERCGRLLGPVEDCNCARPIEEQLADVTRSLSVLVVQMQSTKINIIRGGKIIDSWTVRDLVDVVEKAGNHCFAFDTRGAQLELQVVKLPPPASPPGARS